MGNPLVVSAKRWRALYAVKRHRYRAEDLVEVEPRRPRSEQPRPADRGWYDQIGLSASEINVATVARACPALLSGPILIAAGPGCPQHSIRTFGPISQP